MVRNIRDSAMPESESLKQAKELYLTEKINENN